MILTEIKSYLFEKKRAVLIDIARHFGLEPDVAKGMLEHWIRKGKVCRIEGRICNKGCCQSDPANLEIYEWISTKEQHSIPIISQN